MTVLGRRGATIATECELDDRACAASAMNWWTMIEVELPMELETCVTNTYVDDTCCVVSEYLYVAKLSYLYYYTHTLQQHCRTEDLHIHGTLLSCLLSDLGGLVLIIDCHSFI